MRHYDLQHQKYLAVFLTPLRWRWKECRCSFNYCRYLFMLNFPNSSEKTWTIKCVYPIKIWLLLQKTTWQVLTSALYNDDQSLRFNIGKKVKEIPRVRINKYLYVLILMATSKIINYLVYFATVNGRLTSKRAAKATFWRKGSHEIK